VIDDLKRNVEIHIPSDLGYEKVAMEAAAATAKQMGFSPDRIQDLKTAVAEACLNAMEHGNELEVSTRVVIVLTVQPDSLEVNVADTGKEQLPAERQQPGLPPKYRGWGMFLIEKLMDEVQVSSEPNGNQVRMVIYLDK
jgi:serine/threonine-protein kinase RsbW